MFVKVPNEMVVNEAVWQDRGWGCKDDGVQPQNYQKEVKCFFLLIVLISHRFF